MNTRKFKNSLVLILSAVCVMFFAQVAIAANVGDSVNFNVEVGFETSQKPQIQAVLVKISPSINFYIDRLWWESRDTGQKNEIFKNLDSLSNEFDSKIYPTLTALFGTEWRPGIDNDPKITILIHETKEGVAGYFRSADQYEKLQVPHSNEREMIYLSTSHLHNPQLKSFFAHEFVHLITFNQKDRLRGVKEEVWLNELRAEYAVTVLGYNNPFEDSNLQMRVRDFLNAPLISLTEWRDSRYDYGIINLFAHYLVDHYGIAILRDSMQSNLVGISSINAALLKNGFRDDFSQIFVNWAIATVLNDCSLNSKHCYRNPALVNFKINPPLNFLPLSGSSTLSSTNIIKNWSANWQKIIGGNGDLLLSFETVAGIDLQIPYILFDKNNNHSVQILKVASNGKTDVTIPSFQERYNSLVIVPVLGVKLPGYDMLGLSYPYTFKTSILNNATSDNSALIQSLLTQIESLKKQIANISSGSPIQNVPCVSLDSNLYVGVQNRTDVMCLQSFLKNQGQEIYPEGLVTGNFAALTRAAVIRFQQKHGILNTGYVGILTRAKINDLLRN